MTESSQFGPRLGDANYKRFFDLSAETFSLYHNKIREVDSTDLIVQFWARLKALHERFLRYRDEHFGMDEKTDSK